MFITFSVNSGEITSEIKNNGMASDLENPVLAEGGILTEQ